MPASVLSQTGEMRKVVDWTAKAYESVQNTHLQWNFLRDDFSFSTIASTANYTKAAVTLTELGAWKDDSFRCYLTATGVSDEQELEFVPWDDFRFIYLRGTSGTQTGRPVRFSILPDMSVTFHPIPDAVYTVTGEYFKRAQVMSANADEPIIPREYQQIIVWRALMFYGAERAAPEKYSHGNTEYRRLLRTLERNQLPKISYGAPLA